MPLVFDRLYDGETDTLPPISEGQVYFLTTDKRLYAAVDGNWQSFGVPRGLVLVERSSGSIVQYDGTTFVSVCEDSENTDYQPQIDQIQQKISTLESSLITSTLVNTIVALATLPVSYLGKKVFLDLIYRKGDFILRSGAIPFADPNQCVYISSTTDGYYWERVYDGPINFLWCGANPNYTPTVDNWAAWIQAIRFCGLIGKPLYVPTGRYGFVNAPQLIQTEFYSTGLLVYGDGQARTILDLRSVKTSPNFMTSSNSDSYYLTMRDIGVIGDIAGYVFQMGKSDMSDPPNMPRMQNAECQYSKLQ